MTKAPIARIPQRFASWLSLRVARAGRALCIDYTGEAVRSDGARNLSTAGAFLVHGREARGGVTMTATLARSVERGDAPGGDGVHDLSRTPRGGGLPSKGRWASEAETRRRDQARPHLDKRLSLR